MILLDTDRLSVFTDERDPRHEPLNSRMEAAAEQIACTIVNVEEVLRGWLAIIHRLRDVHKQIPAYERLRLVPFDQRAADRFASLRRQRMDLKVASIALAHDALVVTANQRDFSLVPELRYENWLQG